MSGHSLQFHSHVGYCSFFSVFDVGGKTSPTVLNTENKLNSCHWWLLLKELESQCSALIVKSCFTWLF